MVVPLSCMIGLFLSAAGFIVANGQAIDCPENWTPYDAPDGSDDQCYSYFAGRDLSYDDGRQLCQSVGADLPVLKHPNQKDALLSVAGNDNERMVWLGLSDRDSEGDWRWTDGSPFQNDSSVIGWHYWNAQVIEPNGKEAENCAMIYKPPTTYLVDNKCYWNAKIVCQKQAGTGGAALPATTDLGSGCPDGWMYRDSSEGRFCYKTAATRMTWTDGQAYCESEGARLPTLHEVQDAELVWQITNTWGHTWAGISDVETEGTWKWTDGTTFSDSDGIKWQPGNPKAGTGCGEVYHNMKLIDTSCTATKVVVCQKLAA